MYDLLLCWPGGYLFFRFTFFPSKTLLPCRGGQKRGSCPAVLSPDLGTVSMPHLSYQHSGIKSPSESVLNNWYFLSAITSRVLLLILVICKLILWKSFSCILLKSVGWLDRQLGCPVVLGWFQVHPIHFGYLIHYLHY